MTPDASRDDMKDTFDKAVDAQQRMIGIGVGVGVGLFLLFAGLGFWAFRRHSKKRSRQINQQAQIQSALMQPRMQRTDPPQSWMRQGQEVDGMVYRSEVEAQDKQPHYQSQHYQEMNANPYGNQFQGGPMVEAQGTRDPQEMALNQRPPQEMPGNGAFGQR
ncbi:uncharacterized protein J4E79_004646 [Alternaria viburni]|uniref:uncharacterized protein n=1 Tax=Alternaria viburni TaxID=566460 RepID=UPI0020C5924F|nr:uncharacterized protein J4E79_004646 [Alternaria viburni]KAI4662357.1 hypothetical protein J4E79_004646 [Alternaria viburni]